MTPEPVLSDASTHLKHEKRCIIFLGLKNKIYINIFLIFSNFHFQKGVQVILALKLKIRIMSIVTMLKHNIIYKRCLVIFNKSCFNI